MVIAEQTVGAVHVLKPDGPLKGDDAGRFKDRILELLGSTLGRCVVDASAIQYVDSKGLEALVEANEAIAQSGRTLKICGAGEAIQQVLELTELAPQFEQFPDVNAAVRSFL